jgi:hypothetical protein
VVEPAPPGHEDCEEPRHGAGPGGGRPQARRLLHRMWSDETEFRFGKEPARPQPPRSADRKENDRARPPPERANRVVPVGTMGEAISLRVQSLPAGG